MPVLRLRALFIFGPERLPTMARDAARGLKRLRVVIESVRAQVGDELGEDFAELRDLDLRRYHPRAVISHQLFGEDVPSRAHGSTNGTIAGHPRSSPSAEAPALARGDRVRHTRCHHRSTATRRETVAEGPFAVKAVEKWGTRGKMNAVSDSRRKGGSWRP